MFTYLIDSRVPHPTLLTGFLACLEDLPESSPGRNYRLTGQEEAHLVVLDFTSRASLEALTPEESCLIQHSKPWKIVVLLSAAQQLMACQLISTYKCSLLCVDERQLCLRELVESSLKKRCYISPIFIQVQKRYDSIKAGVEFTLAETKVLNGLRRGMSGIQISLELFRSQKTISSHKRKIMQKLGLKNNLELRKVILALPKR